MGDAFDHEPQGAFLSALDWLDKPFQGVGNLLAGRPGAAGRNALDFLFDIPDALLPGDWIPRFATEEDKITGSELVGVNKEESPVLGFLADVGVGTALNPLSFIAPGASAAKAGATALKAGIPFTKKAVEIPGSAEAIGKVTEGAKALYSKVPDSIQKKVSSAGHGMRGMFAAEKPGEVSKSILEGGRAGRLEAEAGMKATKKILEGTDVRQRSIIGDAIENVRFDGRLPSGELLAGGGTLAQRIAAHPELLPGEAEHLIGISDKIVGVGKNQKLRKGIFSKEAQERLSDEYSMRAYKGLDEEADLAETLSSANPMKDRKLEGWKEIRGFLERPGNEGVEYHRDILERMLSRSKKQGTAATRADVGAGVMKAVKEGKIPKPDNPEIANQMTEAATRDFALSDPTQVKAVNTAIEQLKKAGDIDGAKLLHDTMHGLPEPGWFGKMLNKVNSIFKPAATMGYVLPRMNFNVRNRLSAQWQVLSDQDARQHFGSMAKRIGSDILGAVGDGLGIKAKDKLGKVLNAWEDALAVSQGSAQKALLMMGAKGFEKEAKLLGSGILDGFVRSEEILSELTKPGVLASLHRKAKWPAKITKGIEDRMRLGLALDAMEAGKAPLDAARVARGALFSYDVTSSANAAYRRAIPFGQFSGKAVAQQGKFLTEQPSVAVALSQALQDRGDPVYPWLSGKTNIPIGADEEGNDQYITGLGLPFEALNMIPNPSGSWEDFGRDIEKNVVGSATPPLKALFSNVAGEDPYFQTPYGSYDKIPGFGEAGDIGQMYNKVAGSGMIQPLDSLLKIIDDATDPRHTAVVRLLDSLTGINVASVDPDRALQQQLQQALESDPDIRQYRSFYDPNGDPAAAALLQQYQEAKKRVKAKRASQP